MAVARTGKSRSRQTRPSSTRPASDTPRRSRRKGGSDVLPGWSDLTRANQRTHGAGKGVGLLENVPTRRFALLVASIAILCTMYVGHVHATQDLLADVQEVRRENLRLHLKYNRLKGEFDRMTGPAAIYERAGRMGLVEEPAFGPTIELNQSR